MELWQEIQEAIYDGMGIAGEVLGPPHDVFRPTGTSSPLDPGNLTDTLPVSWNSDRAGFAFNSPNGYGKATGQPLVDGNRVAVGDYLVRSTDGATWFIGSMEPMLPILAVRCNATISILRPGAPASVGAISTYGGDIVGEETALVTDWPVSLLDDGRGHGQGVGLPGDVQMPAAEILVPAVPGVIPAVADTVNDEKGRRWKVASFEETALGWRIRVNLATA